MAITVPVSQGCCNIVSQIEWLRITEIYYLSSSGTVMFSSLNLFSNEVNFGILSVICCLISQLVHNSDDAPNNLVMDLFSPIDRNS